MSMLKIMKKCYFFIAGYSLNISSPSLLKVYKLAYWFSFIVREFFVQLLRIVLAEPVFKSMCTEVGKNVYVERVPRIQTPGTIKIGDNVKISGIVDISFNQKIFEHREFSVGENTFIGHNCIFSVAKKISVGSNCYIANSTIVRDNDGHPIDYLERRNSLPVSQENVRPVTIGDDVWIGRGANILKGVTIGSRSIIGSLAVVREDVPEDSIVTGNPAKIIKQIKQTDS